MEQPLVWWPDEQGEPKKLKKADVWCQTLSWNILLHILYAHILDIVERIWHASMRFCSLKNWISPDYHSKNNTAVACSGRRWCWSFDPLLIVIRAVVVYNFIRFVIHTSWYGMTKLCTPQQGYTFTIAVTANARLCMENDASFGSMTMCHHSRVK